MPETPLPVSRVEGEELIFRWESLGVTIRLVDFANDSRNGPRAEAWFSHRDAGHLHVAAINLLSGSGKRDLAKTLLARDAATNWADLLEQCTVLALQHYRSGEPFQRLEPAFKSTAEDHVVRPLIVRNVANLLSGDGGAGKSLFAVRLAQAVELGESFAGFDVTQGRCAYLDWEWSREEHADRLARFGGDGAFLYRRSSVPLSQQVKELGRELDKHDIDLVIADSLGYALGADPSEARFVVPFFSAIRQLGRTWLILHHVSKERRRESFGSVYIRNSVRSSWVMVRSGLADRDGFAVALKHDKSNVGRIERPIGLRFTFEPTRTHIERTDVSAVPELLEGMGARTRIVRLLEQGALALDGIASGLDLDGKQVRARLSELKRAGKVIHLQDGTWGLLDESDAQP